MRITIFNDVDGNDSIDICKKCKKNFDIDTYTEGVKKENVIIGDVHPPYDEEETLCYVCNRELTEKD